MEGGYACSYTPLTAGSARATEFDDLEAVAKTNRIGMWGACTTITCGQ